MHSNNTLNASIAAMILSIIAGCATIEERVAPAPAREPTKQVLVLPNCQMLAGSMNCNWIEPPKAPAPEAPRKAEGIAL